MAKKFEISTVLKFIDRATRPIRRIGRQIGRFSRGATRSIKRMNKSFKDLGQIAKGPLTQGIAAATVAMTGLGVAAGKVVMTGAEFEKSLVVAATKFPGRVKRGTEAYKILEDAARHAGATTEFTATQSALALKELGAAGLEVADASKALVPAINLATSAELEVGEAAKLSMRALGAMGLAEGTAEEKTKNLVRVMDVMKVTSDSAAQTLEDVAEAIIKGGGTAVTFKQDIEQMSSALIAMARAGIVGQEAGIAYRNIMLRLTDPTSKARKEIKKMGLELEDGQGNMRDLTSIVGDLSEKLEGMGTREKGQVLSRMFGARPINAFNKLLDQGSVKLREFEQVSREAFGSMAESAADIRNTTAGSLDSLSAAIESVVIDLFKLKDSGIKGVIDSITEWIRTNKELITSRIGDFMNKIIDNADTILTVIKNIGAAAGSVWLLVKAMAALKGIMAIAAVAKANPYVLIAMAIAAAAGLIIANWDEISAFFAEFWAVLKGYFQAGWDFIKDGPISALMKIVKLIVDNWSSIYGFFAGLFKSIVTVLWKGVKALVMNGPIGWMIKLVKFIIDNWNDLPGAFKKVWDRIGQVLLKGIKFLGGIIGFFVDDLANAIGMVKEFFGLAPGKTPGTSARPQMSLIQGGAGPLAPQMVSPEERTANFFERREDVNMSRAELVIKDESGRAEFEGGGNTSDMFVLERTGTFDE